MRHTNHKIDAYRFVKMHDLATNSTTSLLFLPILLHVSQDLVSNGYSGCSTCIGLFGFLKTVFGLTGNSSNDFKHRRRLFNFANVFYRYPIEKKTTIKISGNVKRNLIKTILVFHKYNRSQKRFSSKASFGSSSLNSSLLTSVRVPALNHFGTGTVLLSGNLLA